VVLCSHSASPSRTWLRMHGSIPHSTCVFMLWCLIKPRDTFTLYLHLSTHMPNSKFKQTLLMSLHIHVTYTVNTVLRYIKKRKKKFHMQNTETSSLCLGLCILSGDASAIYNNICFNLRYLQNLVPGTFCITLSYFKLYINQFKKE
jgi:hypothetical protein